MSDYFIYAQKSNGYFVKISDRALNDSSLVIVPTVPPSAFHKWDGGAWISLNQTEMQEIIEEAESEDDEPAKEFDSIDIVSPTATETQSLVFWGSDQGDRLANSGIKLLNNRLTFPYDLNLIGKKYLINGKNITSTKDRQKVIKTNQKNYSSSSYAMIPDLQLTSANLEPSLYKIEVELLLKVSKNNRDFEVSIFINNQKQNDNSLNIDFSRAWDDKPIFWSDEIVLNPHSSVKVYWRKTGNNATCYVERRKLLIYEI